MLSQEPCVAEEAFGSFTVSPVEDAEAEALVAFGQATFVNSMFSLTIFITCSWMKSSRSMPLHFIMIFTPFPILLLLMIDAIE